MPQTHCWTPPVRRVQGCGSRVGGSASAGADAQTEAHWAPHVSLQPAEAAPSKPLSSPTGVASLLTASVRSAASSASDLAAADEASLATAAGEVSEALQGNDGGALAAGN